MTRKTVTVVWRHASLIPLVPSVTAATLPGSGAVSLVRRSEEPPAAHGEAFRGAVQGVETPQEELPRVSHCY